MDTLKGFWGAVIKILLSKFQEFIAAAIPKAKQILIAEYKDVAAAVVKELSMENLTNEAKRLEAFKRIKDAIVANGKEASGNLVNLLIELAYSELLNKKDS